MEIVYVVIYGEYYEQHVDSIFTDEEDAHNRAKTLSIGNGIQFAEVIKRELIGEQ